MGDASAARHQGGLFSFIGKAFKTVAKVAVNALPFPASGIARALTGPSVLHALPGLAAQFVPSAIPGVAPHPSSSPLAAPVSTLPGLSASPKAPRNLSGKTLRVARRGPARRARGARRATNAATRARLRRLGYRV